MPKRNFNTSVHKCFDGEYRIEEDMSVSDPYLENDKFGYWANWA